MRLHGSVLIGFTCAVAAMAQDPPSRVARLSLVSGPVSFQPASVDDWTAATLNYPLTTGDHLYTDRGAAAEIRMGPEAIRLASQTNFGFLNLDDRVVQMRLTEGSVNVRIRGLGDQDVWEIDTPNGAVSLLRAGEYRIDTDPGRNATMVTVWGGEAEVTANGQSFPVRPQQTAYFTGDGRQENIQSANAPDDFDRFARDRDRLEDAVPAPQFVSDNMVGYEDLDRYGSWEPSGEYGPVWRPRVRAGWAPYHEGRWAWRDPWGWTWVDDAPWGFAPFHYGRWAYIGNSWGWCPGPVVVRRPVYAPALVAFVGGSGIGWFPLGPREIYAPSYRVSPRYLRDVNRGHDRDLDNVRINNIIVNRNVTNVYVNRNAPGAFASASRQDFASFRPVQQSGSGARSEQFRGATVAGFSPGIAPQRESFGRFAGNVARPGQDVFNRAVIARTPPPAAPVPFSARQQAIQANGGRPLAQDQLDSLRTRQGSFAQPPVRSAVNPGQGFGRKAGQPQSPGDNRGFGRNTQTNTQPAARPAEVAPARVAAPATETPQDRGFGRPRNNEDRFNTRPQQAVPPVSSQPAAPAVEAPQNRGFGRDASRPPSVPQTATPAAPENRGFGRTFPRETPQPEPVRQVAPAAAQPENRGFGRSSQPPQQAPQQQAPRTEAPAAENRGFGRPQAAREESKQKEERPKQERQKEERPKEEKQKEERRFR